MLKDTTINVMSTSAKFFIMLFLIAGLTPVVMGQATLSDDARTINTPKDLYWERIQTNSVGQVVKLPAYDGTNLGTVDVAPGTSGFNPLVFDGSSFWLGVTGSNKVVKRPIDE